MVGDKGEGEGTDGAPLLPKCRPPLQPGGMPKLVSKLVLNAAVTTVEEELGMIVSCHHGMVEKMRVE